MFFFIYLNADFFLRLSSSREFKIKMISLNKKIFLFVIEIQDMGKIIPVSLH